MLDSGVHFLPKPFTLEQLGQKVLNVLQPANSQRRLIASVDAALRGLGQDAPAVEAPEKREPAVPIKKSLTRDYLICLEDGRKFKSLRRHLAVSGMTPDDYRAKWGLPADYPMVAPNYAAQRSELAKGVGLGQTPQKGGAG